MDLEVVEADPPSGSTEETVSAGGRRKTRGTYVLEELPAGGARISFQFAWMRAPLIERLAAPIAPRDRAAWQRAIVAAACGAVAALPSGCR